MSYTLQKFVARGGDTVEVVFAPSMPDRMRWQVRVTRGRNSETCSAPSLVSAQADAARWLRKLEEVRS